MEVPSSSPTYTPLKPESKEVIDSQSPEKNIFYSCPSQLSIEDSPFVPSKSLKKTTNLPQSHPNSGLDGVMEIEETPPSSPSAHNVVSSSSSPIKTSQPQVDNLNVKIHCNEEDDTEISESDSEYPNDSIKMPQKRTYHNYFQELMTDSVLEQLPLPPPIQKYKR